MTFKNEGEFNRWWTAELRKCNALVLSVVGGLIQNPGWPDRYVAHPRWSGWLEGKVKDRTTTPDQRHIMCKLRQYGVPAYVIRLNIDGYIYIQCGNTNVKVKDGDSSLGARLLDACITMDVIVGILKETSNG